MTKILITGGTGLIGKHLSKLLEDKGYEVAILSRNPKKENEFKWDVSSSFIDPKAIINTDYVIHLAGAGIADKKWSVRRKKVLISSRVDTGILLHRKIKEHNINLKKFISASGIGFYGATTSKTIFKESDDAGSHFIADICVKWEDSAYHFKKFHAPVTILRTGIVLAKNGGALQKMNTPFFLSALGNGKQYMPWIHIDDLCNLYLEAIENPNFNGVFNAVAPNFQTNTSFTKTLGKVVKKFVLPINAPTFLLKFIFGEMADILLKGSRISAEKTKNSYNFMFSDLELALKDVFKK